MAPATWRAGLQSQEKLGQYEVELKGMNPELKSSLPPPLGLAAHPWAGPLHNHPRPPPTDVRERKVA